MTLEVKYLQLKPIPVEAVQFTGGQENAADLLEWVSTLDGSAIHNPPLEAYESPDGQFGTPAVPEHILLDTPAGVKQVSTGEWVIRDLQGKFFTLNQEALDAKYEEI